MAPITLSCLILHHLLYPPLPGVYDKDHVVLSSELQSPGALISLEAQRLHRHSLCKAELIFLATLPPPPTCVLDFGEWLHHQLPSLLNWNHGSQPLFRVCPSKFSGFTQLVLSPVPSASQESRDYICSVHSHCRSAHHLLP